MKNTHKAHIAVLATNLFFAINYSFVKYISPSPIGPYALNLLRVGGSLVLFWTLWLFAKNKVKLERRDVGRLMLCGLLGVALNQMLFIKGLTMTSAIHASLLTLCSPIMITVLSFWILRERFTVLRVAGLILGVLGSVMLIAGQQGAGQPEGYLIGDILIILNAISYAFYFILVKPLMERYTPLQVIRWVFTFGFIMMLPIGIPQFTRIHWELFDASHWGTLAFVVIAGTSVAYLFNAYGIRVLGPGTTGAYIYIQLVFAVMIAVLFFNEQLNLQKISAGVLILTGVYLAGRKKNDSSKEI
ncbi:MAG: EamA family transporter [Chitinophagaceae bacterium]|nr:EamA family transporter [Chitinophagaceae bacterium]